ncbi:EamA family transporter [Flavobacterium aquidurense]|jgi:drug/metabolite transporter (DMT)-like permease|uniref:DMT family transporter n=1 Tax=Flavobacterium aquidurense TaxID=362413 RepID=UPI000921FA38|nr:EamA family transporter [Flavobacterium aquidurense]OXA74351.1 EamA family transporter [Flavobacterium aquidurense]SHF93617.1 Permease of the drug/metabolite transporter (DMT) superfamily [Flavobacterium frigidimaris]
MLKNKTLFYHFLATVTIIIWGTTYVSTKILINKGLSSVEIFFYRFLLAYLCTILISHDKKWANNYKDEFWLFVCGLSGGSLFFLAENKALSYTLASNVSLLICTSPLFTVVLSFLLYKTAFRKKVIYGSLIALLGVGLVVFNGSMAFDINPVGDALTIFASILWAVYCLVLKKLTSKYDTLFITRKVFFYGIVSLCFYFPFSPLQMKPDLMCQPVVWGNLLFLGLIASMLCYIMWNYAVKQLGASQTANYIYMVPFSTILTSTIFLGETFTFISLMGALCIITGVYIAEKNK